MTRLVYNQVWEDYAVDREALAINADDVVFMITSGGCNVLNTMAESPRRIVTVDGNPEQHALLHAKLEIFRHHHHARLWTAFGAPAQRARESVYGRGAYGRFAWVRAFIEFVCGRDAVRRFVQSGSAEEQRVVYEREIEPRLFSPAVRMMPAAFAGVCGMHWRQVATTLRPGRFSLAAVCRERLRFVLTTFPIRDNYFWHQMFAGEYAGPTQCPSYLRGDHFDLVRREAGRLESHVGDVTGFLRSVPDGTFTKLNLLDVPDFLSPARRAALFREVKRVAAPGARVIYRSFAPDMPVPADSNGASPGGLRLDAALSARLTVAERTASYGAVHVYSAPA